MPTYVFTKTKIQSHQKSWFKRRPPPKEVITLKHVNIYNDVNTTNLQLYQHNQHSSMGTDTHTQNCLAFSDMISGMTPAGMRAEEIESSKAYSSDVRQDQIRDRVKVAEKWGAHSEQRHGAETKVPGLEPSWCCPGVGGTHVWAPCVRLFRKGCTVMCVYACCMHAYTYTRWILTITMWGRCHLWSDLPKSVEGLSAPRARLIEFSMLIVFCTCTVQYCSH